MTTQKHPNLPGRFAISKDFELSASHELRRLPETYKCSGNHGHNYVVTLTLTAERLDEHGFVTDFGDLAPFGDYLKSTFEFVVTVPDTDFDEISDLVEEFGLAPVWVMPEGETRHKVLAGMDAITELAVARGWNVSTRLHILTGVR